MRTSQLTVWCTAVIPQGKAEYWTQLLWACSFPWSQWSQVDAYQFRIWPKDIRFVLGKGQSAIVSFKLENWPKGISAGDCLENDRRQTPGGMKWGKLHKQPWRKDSENWGDVEDVKYELGGKKQGAKGENMGTKSRLEKGEGSEALCEEPWERAGLCGRWGSAEVDGFLCWAEEWEKGKAFGSWKSSLPIWDNKPLEH